MINCLKCGYEWNSRIEERPSCCPHCKNRNWDVGENIMKCPTCDKSYQRTLIHHKDGNPKNNKKDNQMRICEHCHVAIHKGIGSDERIIKRGKSKTRNYIPTINSLKINMKEGDYNKILLKETLIKRRLRELRNYWLKNKKGSEAASNQPRENK